MKHAKRLVLFLLVPTFWSVSLFSSEEASHSIDEENATVFHVTPKGIDDQDRDGKKEPWRSVNFALSHITTEGNALVLVQPGEYSAISTTRQFDNPVIIRAEKPYQSILLRGTKRGPALFNRAKNIVLEGFTLDNQNNPNVSNTVQILGGASHLQLVRNKITHGSTGYPYADNIKIHREAHHIRIEKNLIFDAMDEEIDIEENVHDIIIRNNILFRQESQRKSPMISIQWQSRRILADSNIFSDVNSDVESGAIHIGNGIRPGDELFDIVLTNNVFYRIHGNPVLGLSGCRNILIAHNLFFGHRGMISYIGSDHKYTHPDAPKSLEHIYITKNQFIQPVEGKQTQWFQIEQGDSSYVYFQDNQYFGKSFNKNNLPDGDSAVFLDTFPFEQYSFAAEKPSLEWLKPFQLGGEDDFLNEFTSYEFEMPESLLNFLRDALK